MTSIAHSISNTKLSRIIDPKITAIRANGELIHAADNQGFSETTNLYILWEQRGNDVVRAGYWRKALKRVV